MWFVDFFVTLVHIFLSALELAMFLRMLLSWFFMDDENKFLDFLFEITEPMILPIRVLFERKNWFQDFPLDMPFMLTFLLLSLLNSIL